MNVCAALDTGDEGEKKRKRSVWWSWTQAQTNPVIPHLARKQSTVYRTSAAKGRCCEVGGTKIAAGAGAANKKKNELVLGRNGRSAENARTCSWHYSISL